MTEALTIKDKFDVLDSTEAAAVAFIGLAKTQPQVDCPVYHHFSPGLYIRELNVAGGTVLVGHTQKKEHLNIFLKGRVQMVTESGIKELSAPMIFTGQPGRKIGYVVEDMVWLNVYATDETDVATLEATYLDKSEDWTEDDLRHLDKLKAGEEDRIAYLEFLKDSGLSSEQIRQESEYIGDQIPFPSGMYAVGVFPSVIEGKGLFATANFSEGEYIAPVRVGIHRTPAGRYINHGKNPNAKFLVVDNDIHIIATRCIQGNQGGITGDEITVDYAESLKIRLNEVELCQEQ